MSRIVIIYSTRYGQTQRVALAVRQVLENAGHMPRLFMADLLPRDFTLDSYDAVVVAAPVFYGKHERHIRDFVRRHRAQLNAVPSALLSVCGSTGEQARQYVDTLLEQTGWRPVLAEAFTGGVAYTRYNPLLRWWMKRIGRAKGLPTDTSRDYDFTDWDQVEGFAQAVAGLVPVREVASRQAVAAC